MAPARARTGWATPPTTATRIPPAFSWQNERLHGRVGSHAGGGWPTPPAASQHRRLRGRAAVGRGGGEGLGARFSPSSLTMAAAGRGGDGNSFRKRGDLPSLVVGAGLLMARLRGSQRADHERREVVVNTGAGGGGGQSSLNEEEAAEAVTEVGSGVQRPAATAGLKVGAGESSSSSSTTGLRQSGGGGGARQQQLRRNSNAAPGSLEGSRRRGERAEWEEMGEWRQQGEEGGAEEMEMGGAEEEWTEVREAATQETQLRRRRQQRRYREGEVR